MTDNPYKLRHTADHVYFLTGPPSQWFPSPFEQVLDPSEEPLTFCCAEQYMMARKAWTFGDMAAVDAVMAAAPQDMGIVMTMLARDPVRTMAAFNKYPARQKELVGAGGVLKGYDDTRWAAEREEVAYAGNLAKFCQSPTLRDWILSTRGRFLVEGSAKDTVWGVGLAWDDPAIESRSAWRGRNLLGPVLERVRDFVDRHRTDQVGEGAR